MGVKRTLLGGLPSGVKRWSAVPYDFYQTRRANAQFKRKEYPKYDPAADAPRHIVCVVVDALRADHIDEATTPYLASLNGGDAITPGTWTFPAVSSLLSGVYPHEHGGMRQTDEPCDSTEVTFPPRMDASRGTITEALAGAGYETYGGFGHDTPFVALFGRFHRHALYHNLSWLRVVNSTAEDILRDYLEWVQGRDRTFAFLHLAEPHIPVDPPLEYWDAHTVDPSIENIESWRFKDEIDCSDECRRYREHRRRLYRASIDYVDDALSRFAAQLDASLEDPLLVVTSDHGEALWEHVEFDVKHFDGTGCVDHGGTPYEQLARVPLLTNADWTVDGPVSLIDIPVTLADLVGIDGLDMTGYSLTDPIPADRTPIVEGVYGGYEKKAIYHGEYKLLVSRGDGVEVGYSLPDEEVATIPDERRERMRQALPQWPNGSEATTEMSGVVEARLEQLGYR